LSRIGTTLRASQHASGSRLPEVLGPVPAQALDAHAVVLLERPPRLDRLVEQHARVQREDVEALEARVAGQVEDHRRLLLKRAGDRDPVEPLRRLGEDVQTAHSPSPRMTWKGTLRFQSMKWFIVSMPNSTGIARSRTLSSNAFSPTASRSR
jgi:hypothetical protein